MNIFFIIVIISLSVNILLFIYFRWYIKNHAKGGRSKESLLEEEIAEVNRCIVDINAVTDRNILLIEEKIKELKNIMEDADKRIAVYVREFERSKTGEALYTSLGRGIRAALNTPVPPAQKETIQAPQQTLPPPAPAKKTDEQIQKPSKPPSKKQIRSQIDALVKEGVSAPEIASRLGISIAEVELAINLIKRR